MIDFKEAKKEIKKEFDNYLKPLGYKAKLGLQGCKYTFETRPGLSLCGQRQEGAG